MTFCYIYFGITSFASGLAVVLHTQAQVRVAGYAVVSFYLASAAGRHHIAGATLKGYLS